MNNEQICGYCGNKTPLNWVHGHGECSRCRNNIEECCSGECEQGDEIIKQEIPKMSVVQPDKQD
jgi:hypothetical protein